MDILILNEKQFFKKNGWSSKINLNIEQKKLHVYAYAEYYRKKYVLLNLFFDNKQELVFFEVTKDVKILNYNFEEFIYCKKYISELDMGFYRQKMVFKNIYAYEWMITNNDFFVSIIENKEYALNLFNNNIN